MFCALNVDKTLFKFKRNGSYKNWIMEVTNNVNLEDTRSVIIYLWSMFDFLVRYRIVNTANKMSLNCVYKYIQFFEYNTDIIALKYREYASELVSYILNDLVFDKWR
jgi:hypothetical protein